MYNLQSFWDWRLGSYKELGSCKELTFIPHIDKVCKKLSQGIGILKKIRYCLQLKYRLLFYNAMIRPVMDYVSVVWSSYGKYCFNRVLKLRKGLLGLF